MKYSDYVKKKLKSSDYLIILDTETTGLSRKNDYIIQFAGQRFKIAKDLSLKLDGEISVFIKPPIELPEKIEKITSITNSFLDEKGIVEEKIFPTINKFLTKKENCCITAYNSSFDMGFIQEMGKRNGVIYNFNNTLTSFEDFFDVYELKEFDAMKLAKEIIPAHKVKNFKQETILNFLGLADGLQFHLADNDVEGLARMLNYLLEHIDEEVCNKEKEKFKVSAISYFRKSHIVNRIYVFGNRPSCYYDFYRKDWFMKDKSYFKYDKDDIIEQVKSAGIDFFSCKEYCKIQ